MSNLLDKASILLTPTAYNDGRMLSVKPNENLYGSELVTNGDFATDSDWTKGTGWSISSGTANANSASSSYFYQNINELGVGKTYKVTYTITSYTSGSVVAGIGDLLGNRGVTRNAIGTYTDTITFVNNTANSYFGFFATSSFTGSIDNVSVVEDLTGDFTFSRSSAATRVNAQGLVENVQIISSELVSNGNFSQIGTEEVSNGNFSQEGSELVTNGDFATDSNWGKGNDVNISGGSANWVNAQNNTGINQIISFNSGSIYKFKFTVSNYSSGAVKVRYPSVSELITSNGDYTFYLVADQVLTQIYLQGLTNGDSNINLSIDNVSVKEVGQDWTLQNGSTISVGEANVISGADNIGNGRTNHSLYQDNIFTIGKSYIVTFDAKQTVGSGYFQVGQGTAASSSILLTNSFVTYTWEFTAIANTYADSLVFGGRTQSDEFVITNISVKEVGQDWALNNGAAIAEDKATIIGDGSIFGYVEQLSTFVSGKKYKVTLDAIINSGGGLVVKYGLAFADNIGSITTSGSYTFYYTAGVSGSIIIGRSVGGVAYNSSITNISVKEITDDTDLPRINYEGFSYQDSLGSEEIVNGTFDTDSDWNYTTSWEISNGKANFTNIASKGFYQPKVLDANKTYRVSFDYSGTGQVGFLGTAGGSNTLKGFANYTEGNNIIYITPTTTTSAFNIWGNWTGAFSIDNVSVKEYLGQSVVPDSGCGSWLLEPQSTNLETKSNDFSNWGSNVNINTTDNYIVSPDGTQNATRLQWTGGGYMYNTPQGVVSTLFTISCYAKRNDSGTQSVGFFVNGSGVVDSAWSLTSDWVRFTYTYTSTNTSLIGIAGNSGADISVFGFQIEQQSYATSYIPTNGAASTRLQDIANNSGNSTLINSTEGVLYAEIAALANDGTSRRITLSNGTASKIVMISFNNTDNEYRAYVLNGGIVFNYIGAFTSLDFNKIALKFKDNDFALYVNGSKVASDLSGASPIGLNRLDFDGVNGALPFYGKTKAVAVYKEALTDAQLQSLTTI